MRSLAGTILAIVLAAAVKAPDGENAEPPLAPNPAQVQKEIEASEAAALARLAALGSPESAAAVAKRLRPALDAARKKAYFVIFKDENPWRFYATKNLVTDGYGESEKQAGFDATQAVCAIFFEGISQDAESRKILEESRAALSAAAKRRKDAGLSALPDRVPELYGRACNAVVDVSVPAADLAIVKANAEIAKVLDPLEQEEVRNLNMYRFAMGFPAFRLDLRLCKAAKGHAEEQIRLGYQGHESPTPGRRTPGERAKLAGYPSPSVGENIESGVIKEPAMSPVQGWRTSPGHHRGMLAPFVDFGVGRADPAKGGADAKAGEPAAGGDETPPSKKKAKGKGKGRGRRFWVAVFGGNPAAEAKKRLGGR